MEDSKEKIRVGVSDRAKFRNAKSPEAIEREVKGLIYWGKDNMYPHELIAWRQDNPIHGGIINQKVTFMASAGAEITGPEKLVEMLTPIIPQIVDDFETFNGFACLFKRFYAGADNWKVEHLDFESVRFTNKDNIFAISEDWSSSSQTKEKTNYKEVLDITKARYSDDKEFILYVRVKPKQRKLEAKKLSLCYYPIPVYMGGIVSILAGIEQDYFTYAEAINGYKGGTVISMNNGVPDTDAKADAIADKIKKEATDRDKQGGIIVLFSDGSENAATVDSLNGNDLDKRYIESNKEIRDKILTSHSVGSPTLFGIKSEAAFGSKEEMETAYTLFVNNYVLGRQKFISESLQWGFERIGIPITVSFNRYVLSLSQEATDDNKVLRQLNSMSPLVATKVLESMTPDEVRSLAKLLPKPATAITPTTEASKAAMAACSIYILRYKLLAAGVRTSKVKEAMSSTVSGTTDEIVAALMNIGLLMRLSDCGVKRSDSEILKSRTFDYKATDEEFIKEFNQFEGLSPIQVKILKMIAKGKTFQEVSKALGKGALYTTLEILKLRAGGYLKGWQVQEKANPSVEVRYSYEVKPGLGPVLIPTSREFCVQVIGLDRLYTRVEIDKLSAELDMDVWRYRGGWYHNPDTGKNTPACRHEWRQNIVRL